MATFKPFKGMVFSDLGSDSISSLTCPPYDIINPAQREVYVKNNPHNIIRLELPVGEDKYADAGKLLDQFIAEGVLKADDADAFYIYSEKFQVENIWYEFSGLIGRVKLHPFSERIVLPHEETLSKAKQDRFNLMCATGCNFSQIYSLYHDGEGENSTNALLKTLTKEKPFTSFTDAEGVTHSLWKITKDSTIAKISAQFEDRKLYIADGHHRYETALNYKNHIAQSREVTDDDAESYVMMMLVNMENDGLVVFPTHRVIHSLADFDLADLKEKCKEHFEVESIDGDSIKAELDAKYADGKVAFVLCRKGDNTLITYKNDGSMEKRITDHSDAYKTLDVSILHTMILEDVLSIDKENMANQVNLYYTRELEEALTASMEDADCSFILNPTKISQIAAVAAAGDKMPQKSTYFYPKLITGLVMNKFEF